MTKKLLTILLIITTIILTAPFASPKSVEAASFGFVQSTVTADASDLIMNMTVTAGNLLVVSCKWEGSSGGTGMTVTDGISSFALGTLRNASNDMHAQMGYMLSANGGDRTYTVAINGTETFVACALAEFTVSGIVAFDTQATNSALSGTALSSSDITLAGTQAGLVVGWSGIYATGSFSSVNINGTAADGVITPHNYTSMSYSLINSGTMDADFTSSIDTTWTANIIAFKSTDISQSHFRFRNDDGSESTATWLAGEDTNIIHPSLTAARLRLQASTTLDMSPVNYQLEYKLSTDNWWTVATTSAKQYATTSYIGKGTFTSGAASLSIPFYTNYAPGDVAILCATTDQQNMTTPTGWTEISGSPQGVGTANIPTSVRLEAYYKVVQAVEANVTFADVGAFHAAQIYGFRGVSTTTPIQTSAGSVESASTTAMSWPSVTTTTTGTSILMCAAMNDDETDTTNSSSQANTNLTGLWEAHDQVVTTGTGGGLVTLVASSSVARAIGNTTSTGDLSGRHGYITVALNPIIRKFSLNASANITDAGENTTAQLSVPGGKSFTAGRIHDSKNPSDGVDIASDRYSEFEWSLISTAAVSDGEIYNWRMTASGTPFTTYTVNPTWTIGTPAAGAQPNNPAIMNVRSQINVQGGVRVGN